MKLSRYEQETIVNYNAGEQTATLYTRDKAVMRKLDTLVADFPNIYKMIKQDKVSDGELREKQTANYFSDIYPIDCAVLSANAQSCPKCCTLLPVLLSA